MIKPMYEKDPSCGTQPEMRGVDSFNNFGSGGGGFGGFGVFGFAPPSSYFDGSSEGDEIMREFMPMKLPQASEQLVHLMHAANNS
jgi:hypothetical protein